MAPVIPVHVLLTDLIDASGKTQRQIAMEIGYRRPNVISMMKKGRMPVPLEKLPLLARALGVDPVYLLEKLLQQEHPNLYNAIVDSFRLLVTANERDLIIRLRTLNHGVDVKYPDAAAKAAISAIG